MWQNKTTCGPCFRCLFWTVNFNNGFIIIRNSKDLKIKQKQQTRHNECLGSQCDFLKLFAYQKLPFGNCKINTKVVYFYILFINQRVLRLEKLSSTIS